jgi:N,N'-diacetyllegionaminate synthase
LKSSGVAIGERMVGEGHPCFVVAEAGVNHNGEVDLASRMVDAAARAGVDAVKFQTFRAERLVTKAAGKAGYQCRATGGGSQFAMLKRLELTEKEFRELARYSRARELVFLSSPFDFESADFLEEVGVPAFKVASGEITNLPLLLHIARKGRPMILSTGMATIEEVVEAVRCVRKGGCSELVLLHCVTSYPARLEHMNLRVIDTLKKRFKVPVGLSDHTEGTCAAIAAVAMGACMVEKHFTLDRSLLGPDHSASLEPDELAKMVKAIRAVEAALGDGYKRLTAEEKGIRLAARKSIVARTRIAKGAVIIEKMLAYMRPGSGLPPKDAWKIVGRKATREIAKGAQIKMGDLK